MSSSSSAVFGKLRGLFNTSRTATAVSKSGRNSVFPKTQSRHQQKVPTNSLPTTTVATRDANGVDKLKPISESEKQKTLRVVVKKFKKYSENEKFRGQIRPYAAIVRRLVNEKEFKLVEEIIEHQKKYPEIGNESFCVRLLSLYGKAGMFDHARKLFDEMPELKCLRTVMSVNALLDACVESKEFDKINGLIRELPSELNVKLDVVSYNTVVKSFCLQGCLDEALLIIDVMESNGVDADVVTFNTLIDAFYKSGRVDDAEKVEEMMNKRNVVMNIRTVNSKLRGLVRQKRITDAVELFWKLDAMGLKPDVYSFNAIIQGFHDEDNLEEAKKFYDEMIKSRVTPDKLTYEVLILFLCERGDNETALNLCRQLIKDCVLVRRKTLQMVVDELVSESKIDEATELIELGKANKYFRYHLELLPES